MPNRQKEKIAKQKRREEEERIFVEKCQEVSEAARKVGEVMTKALEEFGRLMNQYVLDMGKVLYLKRQEQIKREAEEKGDKEHG